jgi:hypothetical protein
MHRREFVEELQRRCGKPPDYFDQMDSEEGPMIGIVGFDDYPVPGQFTYFTHGLHLINKPQWIAGRPEYFITIDREDRAFALFFAYLISAFAFEKVMSWNTLIGAGDSDAVEGYPYRRIALGPPQYLEWINYRIDEPEALPIHFGMAYFISDADFEEAVETGFGYLQQKMEEDYDYWRKIIER